MAGHEQTDRGNEEEVEVEATVGSVFLLQHLYVKVVDDCCYVCKKICKKLKLLVTRLTYILDVIKEMRTKKRKQDQNSGRSSFLGLLKYSNHSCKVCIAS